MSSIARKSDIVLTPDVSRVEKVIGLMTENMIKGGKRFCPCKQSHPLDTDKDVLCPCPTWKEEIVKEGHCFCRLFFAKPKESFPA